MSILHPETRNERILHARQTKPSWADIQRKLDPKPSRGALNEVARQAAALRIPNPMDAYILPVCEKHGVTLDEVLGRLTRPNILAARNEAIHAIWTSGRWSFARIGRYFGGRDSSTVGHAVRAQRATIDAVGKLPVDEAKG